MKIERIMKRYYADRLRGIPETPRPATREAGGEVRGRRFLSVSWEDVLGFIITAAYAAQFLMPDRWFALGRVASAFHIGF